MDIWGCNEIADVLDDSLLIAHLEKNIYLSMEIKQSAIINTLGKCYDLLLK